MNLSSLLRYLPFVLTFAVAPSVRAQLTATQSIPSTSLAVDVAAPTLMPVTASGGTAPYGFAISPALPAGLALEPATGAITGTPAAANLTPAFIGYDDFNTGSTPKWGYEFRLPGATQGTLAFANSRLEFTKATGPGNHFRGWDADPAGSGYTTATSYNRSWVADLVVTNNFTAASMTEFASIGFEVTDAQGNYGAVMLSGTSGGAFVRGEGTATAATDINVGTSKSNVRLRLAWDAGAKVLSAHYSVDGGSTYTLAKTFTPVTQWTGGTVASGFYFEVFGNSNAGAAIASGTVHADNFKLSAAAATTHTIAVTDAAGAAATNTFALTLVAPPRTATTAIAATTIHAGTPVTPFVPVTASGGVAPDTFVVFPALAAGLTFSPNTATVAGTAANSAATPRFVGGDDFNSGSDAKWAYFFRTSGNTAGNGLLSFANSRLEFSKATGPGSYILGWDGDPNTPSSRTTASFATSWVADIDVTHTFAAAANEFAAIGFEAAAAGHYFGIMLSNSGGTLVVRADGNPISAPVEVAATSNASVRLRLAWDATTQTLRGSYSFDGGANYTQLASYTPVTQWSAGSAAAGFFFETFANSNATAAIPAGSMQVDNFRVAATSAATTIHTVTAIDGSGATASSTFRLTVLPNVIVEQPASRQLAAGSNLELRVGASATGNVTYQWFKNGAAIAGATTATLSLTGITPEHAGAYTVAVTHAGGTATSAPAHINVVAPDPLPWQQFTEFSLEHSPARLVHDGNGKVYAPWSVRDRIPDMVAGRYVGALARFNESDGSVDRSFMLSPRYRTATHVVVEPGGELLVSVAAGDATTVIRVNSSGVENPNFTAPLFARGIRFITRQGDGKVIVAATDSADRNAPAAALGAASPTVFRLNADGSLDATFTPAVLGGTQPNVFAPPTLDGSGRIYLVGGFGSVAGSNRINIARLNADGTIDDAYAKPGTSALPAGFGSTQARGVVFQSDGRAVFVGDFVSTARGAATNPMMAVRFSTDGVFDTAFARPLRSEVGINPAVAARLRYAVLDADDKVVAVSDRLVRLNANGSVDPTFVSRAFQVEGFWLSKDAAGRFYVPDQSGVMGESSMQSLVGNGIARFAPNGGPDPTFQTGGWGRVDYPVDAVLLPNDRAWVAGSFNRYGATYAPGLVQVGPNGVVAFAPTFTGNDDFGGTGSKWGYDFRLTAGTNGVLGFTGSVLEFTKDAGAGSHFRGWDADGIAGNNVHRSPSSFTTNWTMDVSATNLVTSEGGKFAAIGIEVANGAGGYTAIMLENFGGNLLVIGETNTFSNQTSAPAGANTTVRLRLAWDAAARTLIGSYSVDGGATFTPLMTVPITQWTSSPANTGFYFEAFGNSNIAAVIPAGQMRLDNFSIAGASLPASRSMTFASIADAENERVFAMLTTPITSTQSLAPSLVRVQPNGLLDATFSPVLPTGYALNSAGLVASPGGKLLLAQSSITPQAALNGSTGDSLVRLNADGTRDTTYTPSLSSFAVVERGSNNAVTMIRTGGMNVAQVLPDGSALLVVSAVDGNLRLLRLTPGGAVDTTFTPPSFGTITPSTGFTSGNTTDPVTSTTAQFPISTYSAADLIRTARQLPDGKIYVAGRFQLAGAPRGLVRLHANGTLDTSFTGAGVATMSADAGAYVTSLAVDGTGRVYAAGRFDTFNGFPKQGIFRLKADGTLDSAWMPGFVVVDAPRAAVRLLVAGNKLHAFGTVAIPGRSYPSVHATADIPPPPSITTAPVAVNATAGGTAEFSVTAGGDGPFTYQWFKDGNPIAGATGATLTLAGIGSADVGGYSVAITGPGGTTGTAPVPLTIAGAPSITMQPRSQAVSAGQAFSLHVSAAGAGPFTYQWRKNGTAIDGATNATLTIGAAQASDAGNYFVVVTNSIASTSSNVAAVTVIPAGTSATHAVVGAGYIAGSSVTITNTINYTGTASALGWDVLLPDGWSFVSDSGNVGDTRPAAGQTGTIGWAWTNPPPAPVTFTYTLNVPATAAGPQDLVAIFIFRDADSNLAQILARPDPLVLQPAATHSADTDRNFRISLLELTRVIELYNTRNGTTRTGSYRVQAGSEDGFAPEPSREATASVTLARYHSADTTLAGPLDGKINLVELTRVIELYNYRSGTTRTGQYRVQAGTEDGFAPGP